MRFPHPVAATCPACEQPTVVAETPIGPVRVHCGTWRWQCDGRDTADRHWAAPAGLTVRDPASERDRAA